MIPVTPAYTSSMAKLQRNRSFMKVTLQIFNVKAESDAKTQVSAHTAFSSDAFLAEKHTDLVNYATLEDNRFVLDGTQLPVPNKQPYQYAGFVSDVVSGADGRFTTPPTITLTFTEDFGFSGLKFVFDPYMQDYVSEMRLTYYNLAGGRLVQSVVFPNSASWEFNTKVSGAAKIVIECLKTNIPGRRARVSDLRLGVERMFDNTRISSAEMVQDVDPMSRRLPTETFTVDILDYQQEYNPDNPNSFWEYIDAMTPMALSYGYQLDNREVEWLEPIWHHMDGKPSVEGWTVTFTANRQIGAMTGQYRKGTFATKTLKQLAEEVLTDALGTPVPGEPLWELDPVLDTISTTAPMPVLSHQECLQLIANAGMCALYTDRSGVVCMRSGWKPEGMSPVGNMDFNTLFDRPKIDKIPPLYAVDVLAYQHEVEPNVTELLSMSAEVDGDTYLQLNFSTGKNVQISVDGATLKSQNIYAAGADIVVTGKGTASIKVTGNTVSESTSSSPLVVNPSITGETELVENQLVTNDKHRKMLEEYRAEYLELRSSYEVEYRGNPEYECGDYLMLQTNFAYGAMSMLLRNSISYNGALRGEAILKRVTSLSNSYYTGELYAGDRIGVM